MFHEANAQRDGIITRQEEPERPAASARTTGSSPAPTSSSERRSTKPRAPRCTANGHYDDIDLTDIPDDYLPRAVYRPGDRQRRPDARSTHAIPEWPKPQQACRRSRWVLAGE
jgi:hypothetical protein